MELLRWKTRISMLWIIMVVNYLLVGLLSLRESGGISGEGATTFAQVIVAFIPFIMAWLSLTLKDSANRWTNLVLGILFAIMFIVVLILYFAAGSVTIIPLMILFLPFVATLLIIWYAWKWPK